jgi:hypothetical protein
MLRSPEEVEEMAKDKTTISRSDTVNLHNYISRRLSEFNKLQLPLRLAVHEVQVDINLTVTENQLRDFCRSFGNELMWNWGPSGARTTAGEENNESLHVKVARLIRGFYELDKVMEFLVTEIGELKKKVEKLEEGAETTAKALANLTLQVTAADTTKVTAQEVHDIDSRQAGLATKIEYMEKRLEELEAAYIEGKQPPAPEPLKPLEEITLDTLVEPPVEDTAKPRPVPGPTPEGLEMEERLARDRQRMSGVISKAARAMQGLGATLPRQSDFPRS